MQDNVPTPGRKKGPLAETTRDRERQRGRQRTERDRETERLTPGRDVLTAVVFFRCLSVGAAQFATAQQVNCSACLAGFGQNGNYTAKRAKTYDEASGAKPNSSSS